MAGSSDLGACPARGERFSLSRRRRFAAVAVLALAVFAAGCQGRKPPPPPAPVVYVAKPQQRQLVDWDDYVGQFEAPNSVDIRPRVTGYLQSSNFRDGQIVKKGQLLFVIDPRPYQAALDQARGQEAHAASALSNARIELSRAVKLLADKAIPEQEYETRLATQQQAAADLLAAQAAVQTAALNLSWTRVTSPLAGRASDRRVAPGNLVTQDTTILTNVADLDPIWFGFVGAESFYLKYENEARQGLRAESRYAANPVEIRLQDQANYVIKGRMDFVDNTLDTNSGTIRARAVVPNPDYRLTPGLFGHLRLLGSGTYNGFLIPDEAITTLQSDQIVYVVEPDGKVQQRKVATGPVIDGLRVVRSGVAPSDEVIIDGVERAKVGMTVTARPGRITPRSDSNSPTPSDLAPPAASATFADPSH
ncbi:MAG TPA: efflux RND transporter periplasmic adaptor subunit [Caulobacteraceae bacterium]|nr:efflux RND transporter periplasmic adaptor subunit [Caulobacteraceae bacterium]